MKKVPFNMLVDAQVAAEYERRAKAEDLTKSDIGRRALVFYLRNCPINKTLTEMKVDQEAANPTQPAEQLQAA